MNNILENSLLSYATETRKKENQDSCIGFKGLFNVIIVADGVGSSAHAKESAEEVVKRAEMILKEETLEDLNLNTIFKQIQEDLQTTIAEKNPIPDPDSYRTTLIVAIETEDKFIVGYVGNGAILHIRGNVTEFREDIYYLPWVCTNYLNPHTFPNKGKETLYKYFGFHNDTKKVAPNIIEISKDKYGAGDILVICTDGIYSNDQNKFSNDQDGNKWVNIEWSLQLLLKEIKHFLKFNKKHQEGLNVILNHYLQSLKDNPNEMTDDCSLGIIITEQALQFQTKIL